MRKRIVVGIITMLVISECRQKSSIPPHIKVTAKNNFFPVTQYLLGQVKELDSLPVTPLKLTTVNNRSDSSWLKKKEVDAFVLPFTTTLIDSPRLFKYFVEKSFLDQTINLFTFAYDPISELPDSIDIKRWVVYVDPVNYTVKRVYIVKQTPGEPLKTIHLTWKAGNYCQVTTIIEKNRSSQEIREERLIWNFNN